MFLRRNLLENGRFDVDIGLARQLDEIAGGIADEHLHHAAGQPLRSSPCRCLDGTEVAHSLEREVEVGDPQAEVGAFGSDVARIR